MKLGSFFVDFRILCIIAILFSAPKFGQTLIINEMSNGPSGTQEYVEFLVVDNTAIYDCNNTTPPCIDIRGWIFDDNSGYHGTSGVASGSGRFSYDPLWSCVPVGTIILLYNNIEPNANLPTIDILLNDGNCRIVAPFNNTALFERNATTPGAIACSYPATGWSAGGLWTSTAFNNTGDCARIVDLSGCEVFSVCYGTCNISNLIYFAGNGGQKCFYFNDGNPYFNFNWSQGTATAGGGDETPGYPNNAANAAYIAQFNNGCSPITPLVANVNSTNTNCGCTGTATASATGSIPGYTYNWTDELLVPIGQTTATATNLCSGIYNVIVTSSIGCEETLQVIINDVGASTTTNQSASLCANSFYTFPDGSSTIITANTNQTSTLISSIGCDSIINTTITLLQSVSFNVSVTTCPNSTITFPDGSSQVITSNTSQTSNLVAANGCDSIVTTTVTLSPAITSSISVMTCPNSMITFPDGSTQVITSNTSQTSNLVAANGCDSIVTTTVALSPAITSSISVMTCPNSTITFPDGSSQVITSNTSQTSNLVAANGCDSIVTTIVTLSPAITSSISIMTCPNSTITFPDGSSQVITSNTSQTSNLVAANGCDSIVTTTVTILSAIQTTQNSPICSNTSYTFPDGSTSIITTNTTQISSLVASNGCDSIITTNLTVISNPQVQLNVGVCQGDNVLLPDGSTQNNVQSNFSFNDTYLSSNGCDSIVTINYIVNTPSSSTQNITICSGQSVTFPDGTTQTNVISNTTYTSNLISSIGCDSLITTNIIVQSNVSASEFVNVCLGSAFTYPDGVSEVIIGNTTHNSNLMNQFGCDSIVTTNVTALSNSTAQQFDTICMGTSYTFPDGSSMATVNQNTIYNSVFNNANGCDSIIETHLHVLPTPNADFTFSPVSPTSLDNEVTFTPNNLSEFSYLWTIQDANNVEILTSTDTLLEFVFEPNFISPFLICLNTASGNLCESTSCQTVVINAEISVFIPNAFSPNNDFINDSFSPIISSDLFEDYEFTIFDRWGLIVFSSTTYPESWDGNYKGAYAPIDTYTYKIYFKEKNSVNEFKFTGHVSIVR